MGEIKVAIVFVAITLIMIWAYLQLRSVRTE